MERAVRRTNCNNCGAVLVNGKCEYCGAVWFREGMRIGEHGYVTQMQVECSPNFVDCTLFEDNRRRTIITREPDYEVTLTIVGMTGQEMKEFYESIRGSSLGGHLF